MTEYLFCKGRKEVGIENISTECLILKVLGPDTEQVSKS